MNLSYLPFCSSNETFIRCVRCSLKVDTHTDLIVGLCKKCDDVDRKKADEYNQQTLNEKKAKVDNFISICKLLNIRNATNKELLLVWLISNSIKPNCGTSVESIKELLDHLEENITNN